jgi:hypothetical protein
VARHLRERAAAVGVADQSARPLTGPVKLPVARANCPVPPVTFQASCCVPLNRQLCGLIENDRLPSVLTRCMVPLGKTRSSRLTSAGSVGRCGSSTNRPTPRNTRLASTTLLMPYGYPYPARPRTRGCR